MELPDALQNFLGKQHGEQHRVHHQRPAAVEVDMRPPAFGSHPQQRETSSSMLIRTRAALSRCVFEVSRVISLTLALMRHLGLGWKWAVCLLQLIVFAALLMPGFLQVIMFYFTSSRVRRGVPYGSKPRNRLDIYVPDNAAQARPVVIYVTGGAWIIGYKAWGALLAHRLCRAGVVVCCLDYRNFPQGTILDMMEDINTAFQWIARNVANFSGDPMATFVVGQSAGAQLAALALLFQASSCNSSSAGAECPVATWDLGSVRGFVGISGAYNIPDLAIHLNARGLHRSLFDRIMAVNQVASLECVSPLHVLAASQGCLRAKLPPFRLIHGEADRSVPLSVASEFAQMLQAQGIPTTLDVCKGKSHTELMIEDSLRGGQDHTLEQILEAVRKLHSPALSHVGLIMPFETLTHSQLPKLLSQMGHRHERTSYRALAPSALVNLASRVCPF